MVLRDLVMERHIVSLVLLKETIRFLSVLMSLSKLVFAYPPNDWWLGLGISSTSDGVFKFCLHVGP
jgi:hypothetical protein